MRIGHVEGKGIIYDSNGELMLEEGEQFIRTYRNYYMTVTTRWRSWGCNIAFDGNAGKGSVFVTDRRLVFVRTPNPFETLKQDSTPYGLPTGVAKSMRAKWILQAEGKEYCEVKYDDIVAYKKKRWGLRFFVLVDGKEYKTGADKEMSRWILPLLNGRGIPEWRYFMASRDRWKMKEV